MSLHNLSNTIEQALTAAGLNTRTGSANAVVETIRKALESARIAQHPNAAGADASAKPSVVDTIDVDAQWVNEGATVEPTEVNPPSVQRGQFVVSRTRARSAPGPTSCTSRLHTAAARRCRWW